MSSFFDVVLQNVSMWISKIFHLRHCLVTMKENWKPNIHTGKAFGILLTGFALFPHQLLMPKSEAGGFSKMALKFLTTIFLTENRG